MGYVLENFVKGMEKVGEKIHEIKPDYIIAPMMGAVPFIDMLNIIDKEFPNEKVEYVPASNKIHDLKKVLRTWFNNFLDENASDNGVKILSLDEVISGNSLTRVYTQFNNARTDYAYKQAIKLFGTDVRFSNENVKEYITELQNKIKYQSIGVVDDKFERTGKEKNPEYKELIENNIAIPINVGTILTMDHTDFFPATYRSERIINENGRKSKRIFHPEIDKFDVSEVYLRFLGEVAMIVGKNPDDVGVKNMYKILDSNKYLRNSKEYSNNKK